MPPRFTRIDLDCSPRGAATRPACLSSARRHLHRATLVATALLLVTACAGSVEDRLAEVRAQQDAGQFSESIEPLRELIAENPDQPEANYLLGVALVQTGQLSQAVWPLEKASADPEHGMTAGLLLASTFLGLQSHEDAARVATQVLDKDPERIAALKIRAQALLGANRRDEALEDTKRLRELAPDDYQAMLMHATILADLGKMDEAEAAHEELEKVAERGGDARTMTRACLARANFFESNVKDDARAEAHFESCLQKAPSDPLALRLVTQFYDERKRGGEATAVWERALEVEPENLQTRTGLAARYEGQGKKDKARDLLKQGVELLGSAQAWLQLADFERRAQQPEQALEAVDQAIAASPAPVDSTQFLKADLLVDLERLDEAEAIADTLSEPSFRDLIRGRVLLARGDAGAALDTFEAGLRRWPNNAGGRYLAGLAAQQLGDFARAESEYREAQRSDGAATDASLALASLYLAQGRNRDAAEYARQFVAQRGAARAEGYVAFIRATTALGNYEAARRTADALAGAGFEEQAGAAHVQIALAEKGPAAALGVARERKVDLGDPEREALLRGIAEGMVNEGNVDAAIALVGEQIEAQPERASLHEIQGLLLSRQGKADAARAEYERALEIDPGYGRAKAGLGSLAAAAGDTQQAIALFDEATAASPNDMAPAYAAAQLVFASGDVPGARQRFEEIVRRDPSHAGARNDLAWLLADSGDDLDRALALAEAARRIDGSPEVVDTLGWVMLQRGQVEQAVELFQQAAAARPESQSIRYHLGLALGRQGERQRALEALRQAVEAGPFPEAEAAKSELARLEQQ